MKKHYLKFGIFYCILALMLFLAAVSFYTKRKIDKVNEFTGGAVNNSYAMIPPEVNTDPRTLMHNMLSNWAFLSVGRDEDVGYYSAIIDVRNNYSVLLETQDFLEVSYYGEIEHDTYTDSEGRFHDDKIPVIPGTERYLFTDGPVDLTEEETDALYPTLRGSITNAKCDDIWIYEGELNISAPDGIRTIPIATYDQVDTSLEVPMEECIVRIDNITPCFMIGTGRKAALYNEAKSCAEVFLDQYLDGLTTGEVTFDRGIFTSRASAVYTANGGDYLIVFYSVEKPLYMVLRDNIKVYIGALAALLIVQGLIISAVRKLYHDQEDFEIRSRKLTYDIASDLKKPLTRTKSYIERWEACDGDKKKQNYSKKIIDEVDSMSDTVSKFLSSGSVRKMRKNYLISGIVFCLATLIIFASFAVLYTRAKIDDINEDIYELVLTINNYSIYHFENCEDEQTKADLTYTLERYFSNELTQGSGIYSSVIEHETGRIVAASADLTSEGDLTDPVLNAEAQKISDEYTKNYDPAVNEYGLSESEEGITRTTFMRINNFRDGRYLLTHCAVYNPLKIVLKDNAATYITGLIIFLILEATILISFINLYRSRKEFELRDIKLTRGIAHELKTPLAVTKATVENWEYLSDEQKEEYAGNVKAEADHMTDMADKLLEVSRISGSESDLKRESVDLLAVTKVLRDRYSELIRERDIDMKIVADEDSYTVYADPDMMEIVIGNYMSNAIKYCDKKITIRLTRSGRKINFSITNDGAKIDKKDLNKIWDVFYTTDDSRSGRINNSGVGLSVVKSILEAHKAEYGCVSNSGGTSFSFVMDRHEK